MMSTSLLRDVFARVQAGALSRTDALRLIQEAQAGGAVQPAPVNGGAGTWLWTPSWVPRPMPGRAADPASYVRWVTLAPAYQARSRDQLRRVQLVFQMADTALNPMSTVAETIGRPLTFFLSSPSRTR